MRKNISAALIVSFFIQINGCYSMQEISKEELTHQVDKSKIRLWTKKNKITFEGSDYFIQNDSIIGRGKSEMSGGKSFDKKSIIDFDDKLALSEVLRIEADRFSLALTIIAVGVPLALIIIAGLNFKVLGESPLSGMGSL